MLLSKVGSWPYPQNRLDSSTRLFGRVISYKEKELGEKDPDVRVWGTALYKLVSYITLAWKRLPKTNTAAYWDHSQDTHKIKWCECGPWLFAKSRQAKLI